MAQAQRFSYRQKGQPLHGTNLADSVMGGIFALIFGVTLAGRILNSQTCHCPELLRVILVA